MGAKCSSDHNNDGVEVLSAISREFSAKKVEKMFDLLDDNQNKRLSFQEFSAMWTVLGLSPDTPEIKSKTFNAADSNNDGGISFKEFQEFVMQCKSSFPEGDDGNRGGAGADAHFHWGYEKHNGPDTWKEHFSAACGCRQSPIDIAMNIVKKNPKEAKISVHYKDSVVNILNNGHTVQWTVEDGGFIIIDGKKFNLAQFHFHHPSEHMINGKNYPICFHFVHVSEGGELAVLGLVFERDIFGEKFLDCITSLEPPPAHTTGKLPSVPLSSLTLLKSQYVHYHGSLTTPPCSEGVLWYVNKTPAKISFAQLAWFKLCIGFENARPIQDLNDRELFEQAISF